MIASITGRLRRKATDYLVIDVAGVGYQVQVPLSTYYGIPDDGEEVSLHIHTHLREDSLSLYGFLTQEEKDMFLLLIGVSGIGPKLALAILSSLPVADLSTAIQASDDSALRAIPGIGKKTAARMVLELKDKITLMMPTIAAPPSTSAVLTDDCEDVIAALVNLGYKRPQAEEAVRKVRYGRSGLTIEELIREALSVLMRR
ncbi:MAG TPA: Holliday junction branch migration protein RuvA [Nitrospirota bacterium]|nr:Holliday junction branch migration protein RuvA [Nitrospirota bacterium]